MLLSGESVKVLQKSLEENKDLFAEIFESVVLWEDKCEVLEKIVWVRCRVIPLRFWNKLCFEQVVAQIGSLVEIDAATLEQVCLDWGVDLE